MIPRGFRIPAFALALSAVSALTPRPADALRFMTYNLLNYSGGREVEFRTVLMQTQPDVLVVEEILSQTGVDNFLNNVLNVVNPGEWAAGTFVNGPDTDNGFFYRPAKVTYLSHFVISTSLRDISEWTFRPSTHSSSSANMRAYVVHLKASQGSSEEAQRLAEVTAMRARMETFPAGQNYTVTGDFNIYTNTESPYQYMINPANGTAGVVVDPIAREGNWHDNPAFADIHSQSPRTLSFGGGATGGMDDRFDMILVGPALLDGEGLDALPATYRAFAQDGQHFNGAINVAPFDSVDAATAQALHDASDHLPVFVDLQGYAVLVVDASLALGSAIVGGSASANLTVSNGAVLPADDLDYTLTAPAGFSAPAGSFARTAGGGAALHVIALDTAGPGAKSGSLTVSSDDPDALTELVPLTGTVLSHAEASVDGITLLHSGLLDLGTVAAGDTANGAAAAHNFAWTALQALLDVHAFTLSGDPRFFLDGGFAPAAVGAAPASFAVGFDAVGAATGAYAGTLTLHTRDQQDLSGAVDLADLVWSLSATVSDAVAAASVSALPDRDGFVAVRPNPFDPFTEISFGLRRPGGVELTVYSVTGRAVAKLSSGGRAAGVHIVRWDGRDSSGSAVSPGIYFARLVTGEVVETRKLVKAR
ncbi:MAG: choice-of-anchor D domain-containing protein [Candidatus Eiseniibacteriota bacterium]